LSYLAALRVHFAGQFQAAPSTVNNDPTHYDNASFKPEYQLPGNTRGWWNPRGNADWRLIGCTVTDAWHADGSPAAAGDPIRSALVADSDRQVAAKLVDLDPEQQLVSTIWGLEVRLCDGGGADLVRGRFAPAAFMDIWNRAQGPGAQGDIGACAFYQSVLSDLEWSAAAASSAWLRELRDAATDGLLSIRFNVDGYNMSASSPDFTRGRIAGTIGVATAAEPRHFVNGRQFMAQAGAGGGFFNPAGEINFCTAVVDAERGKVLCDLGNALPTSSPGGPQADLGALTLGYVDPDGDGVQPLGTIDYLADGWYEATAGVVEVPADGALDAGQLAAIAEAQLALTLAQAPSATREAPAGLYVRADDVVLRLEPGETAQVTLYASRFGTPLAGAQLACAEDASGLQTQVAPGDPSVGEPTGDLTFDTRLEADAHGVATLHVTAHDPGNPRGYIDGQVYGLRPALAEPPDGPPVDPWAFVSLLVYDAFAPDDPPTWWGSLEPVLRQYANLYPVMDVFLDLGDYASVCESRELLRLAFALDVADPNAMPATRDLSAAKRSAILRWLDEPGPDGNPRLGTPPARPARVAQAPEAAAPGRSPQEAERGGKAAAAARRRSVVAGEGAGR
jgi:hypothetical protein